MRKKLDGAITVEASLIVPIVIFVILFVLFIGFYVCDRSTLNMVTLKYGLDSGSEEEIKEKLYRELDSKLICTTIKKCEIKKGEQTKITCQGEFKFVLGKIDVNSTVESGGIDPVDFIRKVKIVKNITKE